MAKLGKFRIDDRCEIKLSDYDPDDTSFVSGGKEAGRAELDRLAEKLDELQELLFAEHKQKLLIILQGMDTSGKDGTVRHVMGGFNPSGVESLGAGGVDATPLGLAAFGR